MNSDKRVPIRIHAKRTRYAAEMFASVAGMPARAFAKRMKRLQQLLGEQHDAVVNQQRLCRYKTGERLAFVAGELYAAEWHVAEEGRHTWRDVWLKGSRKRRRFWR